MIAQHATRMLTRDTQDKRPVMLNDDVFAKTEVR